MAEILQVATTIDSRKAADRLARAVVETRLAACVQVHGPFTSMYWWEGSVEIDEEWQVTMKTTAGCFEEIVRVVRAKHSYAAPEITGTSIPYGDLEYLEWVKSETRE